MHAGVGRAGRRYPDLDLDLDLDLAQVADRGQENLVHHLPSVVVRAVQGVSVSPRVPTDVDEEEEEVVDGVLA